MNNTTNAPERLPASDLFAELRPLITGDVVQLGDIFIDDGQRYEMDRAGVVLGVRCLGRTIRKNNGGWHRPLANRQGCDGGERETPIGKAMSFEPSSPSACCAFVHIDTIKFREHLSPNAPPDEDFNSEVKTEIAKCQLLDHNSGKQIACGKCRTQWRLPSLYRCYYCGVWYCRSCAGKHFESKHNDKDKGLRSPASDNTTSNL